MTEEAEEGAMGILGDSRRGWFQVTRGNIRKHAAWAQQDHETDAK